MPILEIPPLKTANLVIGSAMLLKELHAALQNIPISWEIYNLSHLLSRFSLRIRYMDSKNSLFKLNKSTTTCLHYRTKQDWEIRR